MAKRPCSHNIQDNAHVVVKQCTDALQQHVRICARPIVEWVRNHMQCLDDECCEKDIRVYLMDWIKHRLELQRREPPMAYDAESGRLGERAMSTLERHKRYCDFPQSKFAEMRRDEIQRAGRSSQPGVAMVISGGKLPAPAPSEDAGGLVVILFFLSLSLLRWP